MEVLIESWGEGNTWRLPAVGAFDWALGWSRSGRVFSLFEYTNLYGYRNALEVGAIVSDDDILVEGSGSTSQDFSPPLREASKYPLK